MAGKKIMIISSEFPPGPGGIGKHAYDLARGLSFKGYRVSVFTSQDFSTDIEINLFNRNLNDKINLTRFTRTGITTYFKRWQLVNKWLRTESPSIVIVTGRFSLWIGHLIKYFHGDEICVVAFVHASELSRKNWLLHFFTVKALKSADHIWAVSSFTRKLLLNIIRLDDVKVLPNGLWFDDWNSDSINTDSFSLIGSPALLTVGQLSARKGQHRVVKALSAIKLVFPLVHYHMVGLPSAQDRIVAIARKSGMEPTITFHGKVGSEKLKDYYKSSQIFIMLSENQDDGDAEGYGIAILEANYFGVPAIGARGCGIEDAIRDGFNGRLVDGNNTVEIVKAVTDIMNHYKDYSGRAIQWAMEHDWKKLIDRFEDPTNLRGKIATESK